MNTETIQLADNIITLNSNFTTGTPSENAGIEVLRGSSATKQFIWNESSDRWYADSPLQVNGRIYSTDIDTGQGATEVYLMNQNVRSSDSPTFDNLTVGDSGNTGTSLNIIATNLAGSPAATAVINMSGYEGRAIGTFFTDVSYSGQEWFAGLRYSGGFANYQIGYQASGGQSEYSAQSLLTINKSG